MPEYVRLYDKDLNLKRSQPADAPVEDGLEALEETGVDHNGDPLPVEFGVTKSGQPSAKSKKENG